MRAPGYQKERSERQRARIMELLKVQPMGKRQIGAELFMHHETAGKHLTFMKRANEIHIGGHYIDETGAIGRVIPLYYPGPGEDVVYASVRDRIKIAAAAKPLQRYAKIEKALQDGALKSDDVAAKIGVSVATARKNLHSLRKKGRVFIEKWGTKEENNYAFPLYAWAKEKTRRSQR